MSNNAEKIRFSLKRLVSDLSPKYNKVCVVKNVSADPIEGLMICDVVSQEDDTVIEDVRLSADFNNSSTSAGMIMAPKIDSIVLVSALSEGEWYVTMVSEVDYIYINGNSYGGIVKIDDLIEQYNLKLEEIKAVISASFVITDAQLSSLGQAGGSAAAFNAAAATITGLDKVTLENTFVKHGDSNLI